MTRLRLRAAADDTLLVVASDNGGAINQQGSNRPLRGGKGGNFDGGIRIVAALGGGWLPSNLRGTTSHALTHLADLYATMIDAAGITGEDDSSGASSALMPAIDGRSMWPQWLSNQTDERSIVIDASRDVHDGSIGTGAYVPGACLISVAGKWAALAAIHSW